MAELQSLFRRYDRLVLFDTETTGLSYQRDEIIEFAAVAVEQAPEGPKVVREYDELVTLSPGMFVPPQIVSLREYFEKCAYRLKSATRQIVV